MFSTYVLITTFVQCALLPVRKFASVPIAVPSAGRIVGGEATTIQDVPYQVAILMNVNRLRCGGAIVKSSAILTTGCCINGVFISQISIRYGTSNYNSGGHIIRPREVFIHNSYDSETLDYDIALIGLEGSIDNSLSAPIAIQAPNVVLPDDTLCKLSGWGTDGVTGHFSAVIHKVHFPKINQNVCSTIYSTLGYKVTPRMMCAGIWNGGVGYCNGDFGSPLVVNDVLVGIASWTVGCTEDGVPQVYTSISELSPWITDTLTLIPNGRHRQSQAISTGHHGCPAISALRGESCG